MKRVTLTQLAMRMQALEETVRHQGASMSINYDNVQRLEKLLWHLTRPWYCKLWAWIRRPLEDDHA